MAVNREVVVVVEAEVAILQIVVVISAVEVVEVEEVAVKVAIFVNHSSAKFVSKVIDGGKIITKKINFFHKKFFF